MVVGERATTAPSYIDFVSICTRVLFAPVEREFERGTIDLVGTSTLTVWLSINIYDLISICIHSS